MNAEKECQNQATLAGGKELTDNDLESIVGGEGSPAGHWVGFNDSLVYVKDSPQNIPYHDPSQAMNLNNASRGGNGVAKAK